MFRFSFVVAKDAAKPVNGSAFGSTEPFSAHDEVDTMPLYTFRCESCAASKDVIVSYEASRSLTLVCVACGGDMSVAPVLAVGVAPSRKFLAIESAARENPRASKRCGHNNACRCGGIRLSRPNPFASQLRGGSPAE
jgi:hypothetical protein